MAPMFRGCSALVIRCFKRVEHFADWMTGAAGPVFVFLCWSLISLGGVAFFDVIVRSLTLSTILLLSPLFVLVPLNMYTQYYLVTHVPPGFPSPRALSKNPRGPSESIGQAWLSHDPKSIWAPERWGMRKRGGDRLLTGLGDVGQSGMSGEGRRVKRCRKCDGPKPERTHHCSVCKRCVLLMDHHCPWINACVGLHNQRHFVLFMAWLSLGCWNVAGLGLPHFWISLTFNSDWAPWTPRIAFTLVYVLCVAIGLAVPVLMSWHVYMVTKNETSIESHDNSYLETKARAEGLIYLNPYDLGRRRNLEMFFNFGPNGYPKRTLLFPLLVPPVSNGWSFPRRSLPAEPYLKPGTARLHESSLAEGMVSPDALPISDRAENGHAGYGLEERSRYVMGDDGSLTDDEEGGGGFMD